MKNTINSNKVSFLALMAALILGGLLMWLCLSFADKPDSVKTEKQPLYWVSPMDANVRSDTPSKDWMGMDFIPVYEDGADPEEQLAGTVRISPAVAHNMGVRIAPVRKGSLDLTINTVGYISFDENNLTHFHNRVEGWIEKTYINAVGDSVVKGQKLFELYSPKLVTAGNEYLAALNSDNKMLIDASAQKLSLLGVSKTQINEIQTTRTVPQRLMFYAKHSGYIAELNAREGMFIQPDTTVLLLGGLDKVWVTAEIFERHAALIKAGLTVDMTVSSYPEKKWQGRVDYIYPVVNEQTRTLRARIIFDNPQLKLKPNMFAQLEIKAGQREDTLSIPREAVIRDGQMNRVVKVLEEGRYLSTRIESGIESGDWIEVLQGLQEGDAVVTSAQFLIDSESSIAADLSRMNQTEAEPAKPMEKMPEEIISEKIIPKKIKPEKNVLQEHQHD